MKLFYKEYGNQDAPLLIFLHGGGVSGWMWEEQVRYFSRRFHCVVPDLPEHGQSKDVAIFSIEDSAKRIIQLIETYSKQKIIVIGFSLGAQVLVHMLSMKPNLIDYAVINSALVKPAPFLKALLKPVLRLSYPFIKMKSFSKIQAKYLYIDEKYFDLYFLDVSQMKFGTLLRMTEENMSFSLPEDFQKASGKILVTIGQKEKMVMRNSASDLVNRNQNCKGVMIPNVGHGISLKNPHFFNEMVEMWIEKEKIPNDCVEIKQ